MHQAGFAAPTPIQAQSWPIALQGRDIVAIAKTGSGKTLGYLIPGFIHLKNRRSNPQLGPTILVLSPTRELATQIQAEAVKFGKSSRISCTVCFERTAPIFPLFSKSDPQLFLLDCWFFCFLNSVLYLCYLMVDFFFLMLVIYECHSFGSITRYSTFILKYRCLGINFTIRVLFDSLFAMNLLEDCDSGIPTLYNSNLWLYT